MNNEQNQYPSPEQIEACKKAMEEAGVPGSYRVIYGQNERAVKPNPTRRRKPTLQEVIDIDNRIRAK